MVESEGAKLRREQRAQQQAARRGIDLSAEATRQRELELANLRVYKQVAPSTIKEHDRLMTLLAQFLSSQQVDGQPDLAKKHLRSEPAGTAVELSVAQWRNFAFWYASRSTGKLRNALQQAGSDAASDPATVATVQGVLQRAMSAWKRLTGCDGPTAKENEQVRAYVAVELAKILQLSTASRAKPIATPIDLAAVLQAAFRSDHVFRLAEDRLAFTATLKILAYTASRPGEIVMSRVASDSPDALRWSDITLLRIVFGSNDAGTLGSSLFAKVRLRLLKGKRYDDSSDKSSMLMMDTQNPILCPVLDLFALAHIQDVLDAPIASIFDFSPDGVEPGNYVVPLKPDRLDAFVFRKVHNVNGQAFTANEPATYDSFDWRLSKVTVAANIDVRTSAYAFRRLAANAVNRPEVTAEDRRHLMGHNVGSHAFRAYISRTTQVDVQGLITKGKEDRQAIQSANRLSHGYDLPKAVSAKGRAAVFAREDVRALTDALSQARQTFADSNSGLSLRQANSIKRPDAVAIFQLISERQSKTFHLLKCMFMQEVTEAVKQKDAEIVSRGSGEDCTSTEIMDEATLSNNFDETIDARLLGQMESAEGDSGFDAVDGFEALEAAQDLDLGDMTNAPLLVEERFGLADSPMEEAESVEEAEGQADADWATDADADFDLTLVDPLLLEKHQEKVSEDAGEDTLVAEGTTSEVQQQPIQALSPTLFVQQCARRQSMVDTLMGNVKLSMLELILLMADNKMLSSRPVVDALSNQHPERGCAICGATGLTYDSLVPHRNKCAEQRAIASFIASSPLVEKLQQQAQCPLKATARQRSCNGFNSSKPLRLAEHIWFTHVKKHGDRGKGVCPVPSCQTTLETSEDVRVHLEDEHQILLACTTNELKSMEELVKLVTVQCTLCHIFVIGRAEWRRHCEQHRSEMEASPALEYAPSRAGSTTTRAGFCPWCVHDQKLRAEDAMHLFKTMQTLKKHIQRSHLLPLLDAPQREDLKCPWRGCEQQFASCKDVGNHIVQHHQMAIFGYESVEAGHGLKLWDGKRESLPIDAWNERSKAYIKELRAKRKHLAEAEAEKAGENEAMAGGMGEEPRASASTSKQTL